MRPPHRGSLSRWESAAGWKLLVDNEPVIALLAPYHHAPARVGSRHLSKYLGTRLGAAAFGLSLSVPSCNLQQTSLETASTVGMKI